MTDVELELKGITKRFGSLVANDRIDLSVSPGQVHALLGENGAGKSTLMNVLYGLLQPDEGEILLDGKKAHFASPKDAIAAGIGMVHQHFMLVPVFTVAENVTLGMEETRPSGLLDRRKARRDVRELSRRYGLEVDPDALVENLPVGIQQRVEIIKALVRDASVLILDEPTAVLTPAEAEDLFRIIRQLKATGTSIVFISHKLKEVQEIADTITVLRRGAVVGERRAVGGMNYGAAFDDDGAIGDAEDFLGVLLDQYSRHALLADDPAQRRQEFLDDDRRQPFQRFVEQHHPRVEHQRAPDREHLLLAAGQLIAEILPPLGEPRKQRIDLVDGPAARPRHRGEVLLDGERFEDVAFLRHPADPGMRALIRPQPGDVGAVERDAAAEIAGHPDNGVDQRGLAHAVAAKQRQRLAFGERQRDVRQHHGLAVAGAKAVYDKELRH